jgi:hypothetical protein
VEAIAARRAKLEDSIAITITVHNESPPCTDTLVHGQPRFRHGHACDAQRLELAGRADDLPEHVEAD